MKRWQALLGLYLITAPVPVLIAYATGADLPYEEIGFWIVTVYSAPLWLVSENVNGGSPLTHAVIYWLILLLPFVIWRVCRYYKPVEKPE